LSNRPDTMANNVQGFLVGGTVQSYKRYKITLAVFCVLMLTADFIQQKRTPVVGQEKYWFTDYFTNWVEITVTISAVLHAYTSSTKMPSKTLLSISLISSAWAYTTTLTLVFAYWGAVRQSQPAHMRTIEFFTMYQHAFLPVIVLIDLLITPVVLKANHLLWVYVDAFGYVTATFVAYKSGRGAIYPIMDYDEDFNAAMVTYFFIAGPLVTISFIVVYFICRVKIYVRNTNCCVRLTNKLKKHEQLSLKANEQISLKDCDSLLVIPEDVEADLRVPS